MYKITNSLINKTFRISSIVMDTFRTFPSWSTRDTAQWKLEYSNYIHPLADYSYSQYMKSKQIIWWEYRSGRNRQKWLPEESCFESLIRHIEIVKLIKHWFDVYEYNLDGVIDWDVVPSWTKPSIPEWAIVDHKNIESELNACRFNSEAMKLYYLNWGYGVS